jgi:hypothetical protein
VYRGASGASAKVYWENGAADTGCMDCGGRMLMLYRSSGDKGTPLSEWGGLVSHRTSPAARQLIEWGWALLDLAWRSG